MRLAAQNVSVTLARRAVLTGVDAAVSGGELLGLVGANGAGKSTLLQVLAGLRRPDAGKVTLDATALGAIPPHLLALDRAYLPQEGAAHWPLTAEEVVALGRLPHRRVRADPAADADAIRWALCQAGVDALRHRRIDQLSGGERARVLLARALAVRAPILLADEPIAGLDPHQQLAIMRMLRDHAQSGAAVVAVLHDLTLAARFCTRLLLLHAGTALADGRPDAVLTDPHLAEAFAIVAWRQGDVIVPWDVI